MRVLPSKSKFRKNEPLGWRDMRGNAAIRLPAPKFGSRLVGAVEPAVDHGVKGRTLQVISVLGDERQHMNEEQSGFKVTDRRLFNPDGTPRETAREAERESPTDSTLIATQPAQPSTPAAAPPRGPEES